MMMNIIWSDGIVIQREVWRKVEHTIPAFVIIWELHLRFTYQKVNRQLIK